MTAAKLYQIIQQLSGEQKRAVARALANSTQKKTLYKSLFERLSRIKAWNETSEALLRGKILSNSAVYYQTREGLLEKIVAVLAGNANQTITRAFIRKAVELDGVNLARKNFQMAFQQSLDQHDYSEANNLFQEARKLKAEFQVELRNPQILDAGPWLEEIRSIDQQLEEFFEQIQKLKLASHKIVSSEGLTILERLDRINPQYPRQKIEQMRLRSRALILSGEIEKALRNQEKLVDQIHEGVLPQGILFQEMALLIQLYNDRSDLDAALKWSFKFSQILPENLQTRILKTKLWIRNEMVLAFDFYRLDLAQSALKQMESHPELFSRKTESLFLYSAAVIAFANEERGLARKIIGEVKAIPKKERPVLTWQVEWIRLLLDFDQGEDTENTLRAFKRQLKGVREKYPHLMLAIFHQLERNIESEWWPKLDDWIASFQTLTERPEEKRWAYFFDAVLWLKAIKEYRSMADQSIYERKAPPSDQKSIGFI